jgi:cyclophilin family peptidyl-prolyl cis-trans isomerase
LTPAAHLPLRRTALALLGLLALRPAVSRAQTPPALPSPSRVVVVIPRAGVPPRLDPERIVLRTIGGDIVIALFPGVAPETVKHLLLLTNAGVYDTTHFFHVDPNGYYLQLAEAGNRLVPLTAAQSALIRPMRAEWGPVHHVRGVVSLARPAGNPDGALTSFLIVRKDAPFLDKAGDTYTIVGQVEKGMDVVDALSDLRHSADGTPELRLTVLRAVTATEAELPGLGIRGPQPPDWSLYNARLAPIALANERIDWIASGGYVVILGAAVAVFLLARRLPGSRVACALCLLIVSLCGYMLLLLLTPISWTHVWLGVGLLALTLAIIRLLAFFES